jgi:hypothetical protein
MDTEGPPAVEFDHAIGNELTVWVGGPTLVGGFPSAGRILVVEGESDKAQELRQKLAEQPDTQVYEEVLAAENGVVVRWHRFNDSRLNGPNDLRTWQQYFPNLRQTNEEQRCGRRLGELLDNWTSQEMGQAIKALHLKLRQGDPLAALAGLGSWLNQLETVQLMLPWPKETMGEVETFLTEQNFRQDLQTAALWKRDAIATRDRLLEEKEREIQVLLASTHLLTRDCEVMQAEKKSMTTEIEKICAQLSEFRINQDLTETKIQQSEKGADELKVKLKSLQQECEQLINDKYILEQKLQAEQATNLNLREALRDLFPIEFYRKNNIDLGELDQDSLTIHYMLHGRQQARLKTYQELNDELKSSLKRCDEAETKLEQLEANFGLAKQQLETLKDVFARLAEKTQPPRTAEEE